MTTRTALIALVAAAALTAPAHAKSLSKEEQQLVELTKALHKRLGAVEQMVVKGVRSKDIGLLRQADEIAQDAHLQFSDKTQPLLAKTSSDFNKTSYVFECGKTPYRLAGVASLLTEPETPTNLEDRRALLAEYRQLMGECETWLGVKPPANGVGRGKSLEDF